VTLGRSQNELAEKYINEDRCFPLGFAHAIEAAVIAPVTPRERKSLIDHQRAQITRSPASRASWGQVGQTSTRADSLFCRRVEKSHPSFTHKKPDTPAGTDQGAKSPQNAAVFCCLNVLITVLLKEKARSYKFVGGLRHGFHEPVMILIAFL